ncbi:MAG: hypothetical protein WA047_20430 [Phenylobacterium sp.]|uniref:hypothetical protein n=1 Tax=Phenylobacterium sp. TaxID=1871053 RepID=UPI003BB51EA9
MISANAASSTENRNLKSSDGSAGSSIAGAYTPRPILVDYDPERGVFLTNFGNPEWAKTRAAYRAQAVKPEPIIKGRPGHRLGDCPCLRCRFKRLIRKIGGGK